ncbi:acyltransferase family protein [Bacillus sp. FJAT-27245]|uniref:acyltransferase family protein n=1 Tax=Bacillus sp. FJAT-27245 TaxID=1684144 RepID=UPI0006A75CF5|nr:acyltransferase family protein [Bacillus sp. FJAT-27245]
MPRKYDLDWLRVLATFAVFSYHILMFFNPWPWHVKNYETGSMGVLIVSLVISTWIMPLFFAISGMTASISFQKRPVKKYMKERLARLGIPLLFGVVVLTPPQVYAERISHHQFEGSFLSFMGNYFNGPYLDIGAEGNFAFAGHHLWYLLVLLFFTLGTLPLFKRMPAKREKRIGAAGLLIVAILPLIAAASLVDLVNLGGYDITFYLIIFLYGYYYFSTDEFVEVTERFFGLNCVVAFSGTILFVLLYMQSFYGGGILERLAFWGAKSVSGYFMMMVLFTLARRYLTRKNKFLAYWNEASMPFYILHQPIIVGIGFFLADVGWKVGLKLPVLAAGAFTVIVCLYEFVVKRTHFLRPLFGIKGKPAGKLSIVPSGREIGK